ncbi:erythromycin esterase family protein [Actinopolyspora saharensis]|uniref:Erythromycin esterase n=1 Tax=Actinopolyspora saharensis TaxID=995062 RepID=A0A1H1GMP7_9ACTN|nr:erythromycin esterase family protein [Actinopolyspora saharensis]SDR14455.1 erythromycin esterase [Actinopolyspora saharensis]
MPTDSIAEITNPLRSLDPASDDADLEVLREVVGRARVVFLGESAHFTAEFNRIRDRVLRFLVRELGFSALVLESGFPEGLAVDRWVRGGPGELADVARSGITYEFGRCVEVHEQLDWMRRWNADHERQVGFYGMDVPGWCASPGPGVSACLDRLPAEPGDRELLLAAHLDSSGKSAPAPDASGAPSVPAGLAESIDGLIGRATAVGDTVAAQCARGAARVVEFLEHGLYPGAGRNLRNEVMAENLEWILEREQRVLVAGHNVHLQRALSFDGTTSVGGLLTPSLGGDLVVIGGTHASGRVPDLDPEAPPEGRYFAAGEQPRPPEEHTLEAALDAAGHRAHLVDLRRLPEEALAGTTAVRAQTPQHTVLLDVAAREAFDAVCHVHAVHPARGAADLP